MPSMLVRTAAIEHIRAPRRAVDPLARLHERFGAWVTPGIDRCAAGWLPIIGAAGAFAVASPQGSVVRRKGRGYVDPESVQSCVCASPHIYARIAAMFACIEPGEEPLIITHVCMGEERQRVRLEQRRMGPIYRH